MKAKILAMTILILSSVLLSCIGSSNFINKKYNFEKKKAINLAVIPPQTEFNSYIDSLIVLAFNIDDYPKTTILDPAAIRELYYGSQEIAKINNKIVTYDHTKEEISKGPNLSNILTDDEISTLRNFLAPADFMLLPVVFGAKNVLMNNTFGSSRFRLYDLKSGELIYDKKEDPNVNVPGEEGKRYLLSFLIGRASVYYQDNFLHKF